MAFHLQATIPYVIERIMDKQRHNIPQDYVTCDGEPVGYDEAIAELRTMQVNGLSLVPCCEHVDETGKCLGFTR